MRLNTSIQELEKWNVRLDGEIKELEKELVSNEDEEKLKTLKNDFDNIEKQRKELKEEKVYKEGYQRLCYRIQVSKLKLLNSIYLS